MRDLRVELHREEPAFAILHAGDRDRIGGGRDAEALGSAGHGVAVRHPDRVGRGQVLQEGAGLGHVQLRRAVFAIAGRTDLATERLRHELVAVTDAENRDAQFEDRRIHAIGVLGVDGGRATGEDEPNRASRPDLGGSDIAGDHLGVDVRFAYPPRNQLGVLGAEIKHENQRFSCVLGYP